MGSHCGGRTLGGRTGNGVSGRKTGIAQVHAWMEFAAISRERDLRKLDPARWALKLSPCREIDRPIRRPPQGWGDGRISLTIEQLGTARECAARTTGSLRDGSGLSPFVSNNRPISVTHAGTGKPAKIHSLAFILVVVEKRR